MLAYVPDVFLLYYNLFLFLSYFIKKMKIESPEENYSIESSQKDLTQKEMPAS